MYKIYRQPWHRKMPDGLSFAGGVHDASRVEYLADKTWTDDAGERHVEQEIFDAVFDMIRRARRLIVLDMFLYNDFQAKKPETTRKLSGELGDPGRRDQGVCQSGPEGGSRRSAVRAG